MEIFKKIFIVLLSAPSMASAGECYETSIQEPSPYNGNGGEVIILADGTIWKEVSYQYLYLYEYQPDVVICPSKGKMILDDNVFEVIPIK